MSYSIKTIKPFDRQAKRLVKKYSSLKTELRELVAALASDPTQGSSLGRNCYKVRLRVASKGQGKSGGARVITCVFAVSTEVYLLAIYDKAEQNTITDAELLALVQEISPV